MRREIDMNELALKLEHVTKEYRLGAFGGATLKGDLQSWIAKVRKKEDPNSLIGQKLYNKNELFLAVNDLSFEVKKGEALGLIGRNGAGKSTALKMICRVTTPTSGSIFMNGRIASMLEVGTGFHSELTGRENVYLNGAILGMTKGEISEKFDEIVEFSEIAQFIDTPVKRYSSGMKVKLGFSVAAHLNAEIMIMDEVLAVGDVTFQNKCISKMKELVKKEGRTVIYVSHNMATIRNFCSRCIVLDKGQNVFDGGVEDGIAVYSGVKDDFATEHDLTQCDRFSNPFFADIIAQRIKIIGKDSNVYHSDEELLFELTWTCKKKIKNGLIRINIVSSSRDKQIATAFSQDIEFAEGEQKKAQFALDISMLCPGKYAMDIEMDEYDSYRNIKRHDDVIWALSFDVIPKVGENRYSVWNDAQQVILPNIEFLKYT